MRIDNDEGGDETRKLVFAYYVTGHGFGHATRAVEVARHLILAGHEVHIVSAAPDFVYTSEIQSSRLHIRKVLLDCGAVQSDALTVDRLASLEKYHETAVVPREAILKTEVDWLKSIKADLVISDVVPVACCAAANAGIRSVCITNFSWDFIYAEYVMVAGHHHRSIIWQIAEDYSHAEFLIRLPGYCPMPAFRDLIDAPLVVRRLHKSRKEVRKDLGIADDDKLLILNFGGQPSGLKLKEEYLPAGWRCVVCGASDKDVLPPRFIKLARDAYTPDVIAASDCMLGKIGYGAASEALAYKLPFVFVRRDYFNEEPFVRNLLEYNQCGVEMIRRDLITGNWKPYIDRAMSLKPCYSGGLNGGEVAAHILQDAAIGKYRVSNKLSGARRLRDAIVLGYQLQSIPGRDPDLSVPEWYASAQNELSHRSGTTKLQADTEIEESDSLYKEFKILHGDLHDLHDTKTFLSNLVKLAKVTEKDINNHSREHKAAIAFFDWEEEIYVARAPGRLDVMGGIADYSGSLVLQMPIKEACHVALQKNHPSKHKLWKHAQARQEDRGRGQVPVLQIVSFGAELSNRGPTFDMDLSDFINGDKPISYDEARKYFSRDPSQKWAAYVAGTILVLMRELGVRFENSISMLVSSAVPEGKGVSSSASVEVASMTAIAAAHGLDIAPRDLALLCQMVENRIVGAPCGVMDQMASACGEANKLLAMVCQPAEVLGLVEIPNHIRVWGIDSGIRHSVGGADYGSVRVGAFMGREIIKSSASSSNDTTNLSDPDNGFGLYGAEANLDYLCNLTPHRYEAAYANTLPESIDGETFMDRYGNHNDPVTVIDSKRAYAVRAAARHPVYENFRVKAFKALLTSAASEDQLTTLGELLYQCHYSYNACGLGSDGTDRIVELVHEMQHAKTSEPEDTGLYGAKITGGGSGGTVCVLGRNSMKSSQQIYDVCTRNFVKQPWPQSSSKKRKIYGTLTELLTLLLQIQQRYKAATGYLPFLFEGSSPGAGKFGYLKIRRTSSK